MKPVNYNEQLYLYDDRSKYDYMLKVIDIIFQDEDSMLCKVETIGSPEESGHVLEEKILIDKQTGEVKNSEYYSWYVTSDQEWINKEIQHLIDLANE